MTEMLTTMNEEVNTIFDNIKNEKVVLPLSFFERIMIPCLKQLGEGEITVDDISNVLNNRGWFNAIYSSIEIRDDETNELRYILPPLVPTIPIEHACKNGIDKQLIVLANRPELDLAVIDAKNKLFDNVEAMCRETIKHPGNEEHRKQWNAIAKDYGLTMNVLEDDEGGDVVNEEAVSVAGTDNTYLDDMVE